LDVKPEEVVGDGGYIADADWFEGRADGLQNAGDSAIRRKAVPAPERRHAVQ
jgi:hypothetical protein